MVFRFWHPDKWTYVGNQKWKGHEAFFIYRIPRQSVWSPDRNPFRRKTIMSYLNTKHDASVIVHVHEYDWKNGRRLHSISDWLDSGFFSIKNFPNSPEGHKLYESVRAIYAAEINRAASQVRNNDMAMLDIANFCRISVEQLTDDGLCVTDGYIRLRFWDFKGQPHKTYAEHFVSTVTGGAGLDYTEVSCEHILCQPYSGLRDGGDCLFSVDLAEIFRAIAAFYSGVSSDDGDTGLLTLLTETLQKPKPEGILLLPTKLGISMVISLRNVARVVEVRSGESRLGESWQMWYLEPERERDFGNKAEGATRPKAPALSIRFIPTENYYDRFQVHNPWSGRSLYGFAQAMSNMIDMHLPPM